MRSQKAGGDWLSIPFFFEDDDMFNLAILLNCLTEFCYSLSADA